MKKTDIAIIKLGGSIITDKTKPYTPNLPVIKRLAREIKKADVSVVLIHGQGSFAHTSAKKYGGIKGYKSRWGIAKVARDAMEINRIVMDVFIETKLPAISFRPNSLFLAKSGKLINQNLEPVFQALEQGLMPVLYGDVIMDTSFKTTIFSGEKITRFLINFLSNKYNVKYIVQVGVTDGVLDENGKTIPKLNSKTFENIKKDIYSSKSNDVTGGMMHKVKESLEIAKQKISTYIINGTRSNELLNLLKNKKTNHMTTITNI
jgi:isopentenyl phosphate kinase